MAYPRFPVPPSPAMFVRATPLLRVKAKITVKNAVCMSLRLAAYGEFDFDFDYDSQEWSCSQSKEMGNTPVKLIYYASIYNLGRRRKRRKRRGEIDRQTEEDTC